MKGSESFLLFTHADVKAPLVRDCGQSFVLLLRAAVKTLPMRHDVDNFNSSYCSCDL